MFHPRSDPLLLSEAGLQGLRLSLNTPVVQADELPQGPARAAIVVHAGEYGSVDLTLALRSLGGETLFYRYGGTTDGPAALAAAWEAALAFGESLGFLFDDEVPLGSVEARSRAFACWQAFCGPDETASSGPFGDVPLELDPEPEDLELELEPSAETTLEAPRGLSKFRGAPAPRTRSGRSRPGSGAVSGSGSALGRVPIVKRRAESEAAAPAHPLLEVLASF